MSVKGSDPNSLSGAIAGLEAVDAGLAAIAATPSANVADKPGLAGPIQECRTLLRSAIELLAGAQAHEKTPGSAKRRVKIKAISETTAPGGVAPAETKEGIGSTTTRASAKGGARNGAATVAAAAIEVAKAPTRSLLARLGAATPEPAIPSVATSAPATPAILARGPNSLPAHDAADRLARLEAEIASLTDASIATTDAEKAVATDEPLQPAPPQEQQNRAPPADVGPTVRPAFPEHPTGDSDAREEDDDDTEVVIVTPASANAVTAGRASPQSRQDARVFRGSPPPAADDAEVEIVRPGAKKRASGLPETRESVDASPRNRAAASTPVAPTKWWLFRGSN